jgi:wyosine [tRNA(Phe)-imidazoG37] synthetase (radical SAM superfamily)
MTDMTVANLDHAVQAHQAGQWPEAEALYRSFLAVHPDEPVAGYNLGILLLGQARLEGLSWVRQALLAGGGRLDLAAASASAVQALQAHQYKDHADQFVQWLEQHGLQALGHEALKVRVALPGHLQPLAPTGLRRYHPIESSRYVYAIDVVGGCNLRCPTCPVGQGAALPKGLMQRDLFQAILQKIVQEQVSQRPDIWLFNWGEPLLHPQLGALIEDVRQAGLTSMVSSNLHHSDRIDEVMQANPDRMKVSLSSLRQEAYAQTHVRGDIERVKTNLQLLAQARDRHKATTEIWIGHHLYRHTLQDQQQVQDFAVSLGFGYAPSTAIVAPIETALRMLSSDTSAWVAEPLHAQLLTKPAEISAHLKAHRSGRFDCELRFNMTSIQFDGCVTLCCGTTQALAAEPVAFLTHSHAALEQKKYAHPFCGQCMQNNLHLTTVDL